MLKLLSPDDKIKLSLGAVLAVTLVSGLLIMGSKTPVKGQTLALFPFATQTALSGAALQVIPSNPTRRSINICNGTGGVASCTPSPITPTAANGVQIAASACFTPPPNLVNPSGSQGGAGAAWSCIGTTNITVLEW